MSVVYTKRTSHEWPTRKCQCLVNCPSQSFKDWMRVWPTCKIGHSRIDSAVYTCSSTIVLYCQSATTYKKHKDKSCSRSLINDQMEESFIIHINIKMFCFVVLLCYICVSIQNQSLCSLINLLCSLIHCGRWISSQTLNNRPAGLTATNDFFTLNFQLN